MVDEVEVVIRGVELVAGKAKVIGVETVVGGGRAASAVRSRPWSVWVCHRLPSCHVDGLV